MDARFTVREVRWCDAGGMLAQVRETVFIREQSVPKELEWDGLDLECVHALAQARDGTAIGTGRLLPEGHIGRMAVLKEWRGKGVGSAILRLLVKRARASGLLEVHLNAQVHALGFYAKYGFVAVGEPFMDAGISHLKMVLRLNQ